MTDAAYSLSHVGYRIGGARILDDITLDVHYGRVLALVGPNGAGKSSLLGILSGDAAPSSGSVTLDGRPLAQLGARELARRRSVLLQANQVSFSFTTREVVEMGRAPWAGRGGDRFVDAVAGAAVGADAVGVPRSAAHAAHAASAAVLADDEIVRAAMRQADVSHLAARAFSSLSGGERARASLARVLAQQTPIVLLDEPTAALDLKHQEDVLRIARALAADGRAIVVVLHDLSLAAAYADEIAIVHGGSLVAFGAPAEVLTAPRIESVYETPVRVIADPDTGRPVVLPRRAA